MPCEMIVAQVHLNTRPAFSSTHRTQILQHAEWHTLRNDGIADLVYYVHGNPDVKLPAWATSKPLNLVDRRHANVKTTMPSALLELVSYANAKDAKYLCLLDDDAHFRQPAIAVMTMLNAFENYDAAATGPIGSLREFRKYKMAGVGIYQFNPLVSVPWATAGSQCYALNALNDIRLEFLEHIKFRADATTAMVLYGNGYKVGESPINFAHVLSCGLDQSSHTADFFRWKIAKSTEDWNAFKLMLPNLVQHSKLDFLYDQCNKTYKSEVGLYQRKLAKITGE